MRSSSVLCVFQYQLRFISYSPIVFHHGRCLFRNHVSDCQTENIRVEIGPPCMALAPLLQQSMEEPTSLLVASFQLPFLDDRSTTPMPRKAVPILIIFQVDECMGLPLRDPTPYKHWTFSVVVSTTNPCRTFCTFAVADVST